MRRLLPLIAVIASAVTAHAQVPQGGDDTMSAAASELYEAAREAQKRGDFETCYAKVRGALGIQETPGTLGLRGDCALELGRPQEAAYFLALSRSRRPPETPAFVVEYLDERLAAAQKQVATVAIALDPADARLLIDGGPAEVVGGVAFLAPGTHTLRAEHPDRRTTEVQYEAVAGTEDEVRLELKAYGPEPQPPAPNGSSTSAGEAAIHPAWPIVTGILAAGALGTGIGLAVAAESAHSDVAQLDAELDAAGPANGACRTGALFTAKCDELDEARDLRGALGGASIAMFVVGGALLATTIGLSIAAASESDDEGPVTTLRVAPIVSPLGAGASLEWTF